MSVRLSVWVLDFIKSSLPVLCLTAFFIGCTSNQVRFRHQAGYSITKYNFPKPLLFQKEEELTNEKLQEVIKKIESIADQKKQKFVLRDILIKGNDLKESGILRELPLHIKY